jgi:hypothetical protein
MSSLPHNVDLAPRSLECGGEVRLARLAGGLSDFWTPVESIGLPKPEKARPYTTISRGVRFSVGAALQRARGGLTVLAKAMVLTAIRLYQAFISPLGFSACKFHPSCSRYAYEAVERHGVRRGGWLALERLWRCRPFAPGGHDPVPKILEDVR